MSLDEEFRSIARNAEIWAEDYARGMIVTPATAAHLWRTIARLAHVQAGGSESVAPVTPPTASKRGSRGKRGKR